MLNGVTDLILMKIDVLDDFATIKICNKYEIKGEKTEHIPYNMEENKINPIYDEYKGWKKNVSGVRSYNDLPKEMQDYIEEIEKRMNIPVSVVSISPDRKDTIFRKELK
jgi:adenylosuccinate synthase